MLSLYYNKINKNAVKTLYLDGWPSVGE